ncbi:MAG: cupin domain-containing protein [Acidimicrobiia bacterium]
MSSTPITPRHAVHRGDEPSFVVPAEFEAHSLGFSRWALVDHDTPGAVHTGFGLASLESGGRIDPHVHSYEESFFILEGDVVCVTPEAAVALRPGDYGVVPIGIPHSWRNHGEIKARWADLLTPQPRPWFGGDTYFVAMPETPVANPVDPRDPRTRSFGHIVNAYLVPRRQTHDMLAVSASMRTALLVYSGITVKMMVDSDLGGQLGTMFMVQYEPRGLAGAHDHPLEEAYLILEGEVDSVLDGVSYRLGPGDFGFCGVGAVHEFANPTNSTVRWLETQAPQPPGRHSYRFARDWRYLTEALEKER